MWPSPQTLPLLLFGLVPLLYVVVLAARDGFRELTSLRFAGIALMWVGYQFSPWLAYFSGEPWQALSNLLVPAYIDPGLLFSTLCMVGFLFGYRWATRRGRARSPRPRFRPLRFPVIKAEWVMALTLLSLITFIVLVGGPHEAWAASHARGARQFDPRSIVGKMWQMGMVLSIAGNIALATMSGLYLLQGRRSPEWLLIGSVGILTSSLYSFYFFSRASGFAFLIFAFLSLRLRGRRGVLPAVFSLCIAWYVSFVGFNERGMYMPGVGNFLAAAIGTGSAVQTTHAEHAELFESADSNPLDSMAAWTRKAQAIETEKPHRFQMALYFFWNQNPLPSAIFPLKRTGKDLARIMGTWRHTGLTTPALAVLYYVFGYTGFLVLIPLGAAYGWFEALTVRQPGVLSSVCLLLCLMSFGIGLHSSMRAMTRPVVYAFALVFAERLQRRQNQRAVLSGPAPGRGWTGRGRSTTKRIPPQPAAAPSRRMRVF